MSAGSTTRLLCVSVSDRLNQMLSHYSRLRRNVKMLTVDEIGRPTNDGALSTGVIQFHVDVGDRFLATSW